MDRPDEAHALASPGHEPPGRKHRPGSPRKPFWRTRTLRYTLLICSSIAGVLLFLLASASSNSPFLERYYPLLLTLNLLSTAAMLLVVSVLIWRLAKRYRTGQFGTRLMARFALAFALMGVIPGAVIYIVSVQFLSRSIETWFEVRVDKALESGLALARTTLDGMLAELNGKARNLANELSDIPASQRSSELTRMRDQVGVQQAVLFSSNGRVLASAVDASQPDLLPGSLGSLTADLPPSAVLRQLRLRRGYSAVETVSAEGDPGGANNAASSGLRMRVIVPVLQSGLGFDSDTLYLQLLQRVPQALADNAEEVQSGARDYQELSLSRTGLRKIYGVTLTLTLLLAVFFALGAAFLLSTWLTAPLLQLAAATKAVASGDFSPMLESHTKDELGSLTHSFNDMTRQLDDARSSAERNRLQLENAKAYLESILSNMSAGVLVLDEHFHLVTANHAADKILGVTLTAYLGKRLAAVPGLAELDLAVDRSFAASADPGPNWQTQVELPRSAHLPHTPVPAAEAMTEVEPAHISQPPVGDVPEPLILLARGSRCPVGSGDEVRQGYLIVFDDVSDVIAAQRSLAWGEVARRLAHEIKNPLTPIQLSAERLQMKLREKLAEGDARVLDRAVTTIVNQVTAMKDMVDDFRNYAKTPTSAMAKIDLNALIAEVLELYEPAGEMANSAASSAGATAKPAEARVPIELQFGGNLPAVWGNPTRLRQVIHNLVQNAQDATQGAANAHIVVKTERVDARPAGAHSSALHNPREPMVRLTVRDNGSGFPAKILNRVFEPYVTTKSRGTGLGLAVVKKIADEHEARIEVANLPEGGAMVTLLFTKLAAQQLLVA